MRAAFIRLAVTGGAALIGVALAVYGLAALAGQVLEALHET